MTAAPAPELPGDVPARPARPSGRALRLARLAAALAATYAAFIFWESSQPNPFPFVPAPVLSHDKLLHAAGYAVLAALLRLALARAPARRALVAAVLLAAGYGVSDELHQRFVPGRSADPFDWAADVAGAAAGAGLASAFLRRRVGAGSIRA